jgi:hypothetical protein
MMDNKCCCSHGEHGMMIPDCCKEHKMSKEHLEMKKKMLEEKLKWVNEKLGEK